MSSANKRLRAPNFTTGEGIQLCEIIERYKNIVENKTTDGATLQQKQDAWVNIAKEYNASGPNFYRNVESLQNFYKKLKQKAKKTHAASKMTIPVNKEEFVCAVEENGVENWEAISNQIELPKQECEEVFKSLIKEAKKNEAAIKKTVMGTGGGPSSTKENVLLDKVNGLIKGSVEGMFTVFDGDSELMAECSSNPIDSVICPEVIVLPLTSDEPTNEKKLLEPFTTNRANLKRKKDAALKDCERPKIKKRKETVLGNFSELAEIKIDLVQYQKELLLIQIKEENEKMKHNNTMREMELEHIKNKYEQEHKIREMQLKLLNVEILLKEKQLNLI